jgi:hypothetical protein
MGVGQNAAVAWLTLSYALVTVAATVSLIVNFGPYAAGGGLLVASIARFAASLLLTRLLFFPEIRWSGLFVSTLSPLLAGLTVALGVNAAMPSDMTSWPSLIAAYVFAGVTVLVLNLAFTAPWAAGREIVHRVVTAVRTHRALA